VAVLAAWLYFQTHFQYSREPDCLASWLPSITLMVMTSLLQVFVMIATGALTRIVVLIKTIAPQDQVIQIMIVNSRLLDAAGCDGSHTGFHPAADHAGAGLLLLCRHRPPRAGLRRVVYVRVARVPVVVFAGLVNLPVNEVGGYFARFMPLISTCIAIGMLWLVGQWKMVLERTDPALLSGLTLELIANRHESHPAGAAHRVAAAWA